MRVVVCLCLCLLCLSKMAGATPITSITFDFTLAVEDFCYQFDDFELQVGAYAEDDDCKIFSAVITQTTNDGLGVASSDSDDGQLENSGPNDILQFSFSRTVTMSKIGFSLVDDDDEFLLAVDKGSFSDPTDIIGEHSDRLQEKLYAFSLNSFGSIFEFKTRDSKDDFRIKFMTVDYVPTLSSFSEPSPIVPTPEPSTWLLLGGGLVTLFLQRRRFS